MPKVEKSRRRAHEPDDDVLEEAGPTAMATAEPAGDEPVKPTFAPLSAHEQSGKRLEFRRVNFSARMLTHCLRSQGLLQWGITLPRHGCTGQAGTGIHNR